MRWQLWLIALLLWGCGGGLSTAATQYLKEASAYQADLQTYQTELRQIPRLPPAERKPAADRLAARIKERHAQLEKMQVPNSVSRVHQETLELYKTLEQFVDYASSGSGDPRDPKLKKISDDWARHLEALQVELNRLEPRHP